MHWGNDVGAEFGMGLGRRMEQREFAQRLLAVFHEGRGQRPRIAQFARQQRDPRLFVQRQIGHAGHRRVDQFGDRALVHGGVLPDVEAGKVKAETIHRPAQQPQPPARDHAGIVRDQRAVENIEIGLEFPDIGVRRFADRPPGNSDIELQRGRGEPRIDAGYRQAIGLAAAMRRLVGRALGERAQILGHIGQMRRQRQFGAERVQFLEIKAQHAAALQLQRAAHHLRGHERVAVAVAADPASHPQERRQVAARPSSPSFNRSSSAQCSRGTSCRKV